MTTTLIGIALGTFLQTRRRIIHGRSRFVSHMESDFLAGAVGALWIAGALAGRLELRRRGSAVLDVGRQSIRDAGI